MVATIKLAKYSVCADCESLFLRKGTDACRCKKCVRRELNENRLYDSAFRDRKTITIAK